MKTFVLLTLILTSTFLYGQQKSAVDDHGQLKVQNGQILDKNNKPPQLRGISMSWSIWQGQKYYNPEVITWLQQDFNATVIRLAMGIEPDGGYLKSPLMQKQLITNSVDAAIAKGMYVLIDWHDHLANKNQEESLLFFTEMAKKYSGKKNVIYEIFNEPTRIDWKVIKAYSIALIKAIRKYDKQNLIVVGSPAWDQDVDIVAKSPIIGFQNIAYSFHFYASDPNHQEVLMKKADVAIAAGLPLFVTEWGVGEADGNGIFDLSKTNNWLQWMEKNKLSWVNWNITDKKETTALLNRGASIQGKWSAEQLTPAGKYIREKLKELNSNST
ncbi:MAG: glycoside hydrolase family 5 protein, partial [Flavobacterium sp.]